MELKVDVSRSRCRALLGSVATGESPGDAWGLANLVRRSDHPSLRGTAVRRYQGSLFPGINLNRHHGFSHPSISSRITGRGNWSEPDLSGYTDSQK